MKEDLENENPNETESIDEIIKDELEKAKQVSPYKSPPKIKRQSEAAHKISNAIVKAIINAPTPYFFDRKIEQSLENMIKRAKLDNGFAHSTFTYIEIQLTDELEKFSGSDYQRNLLAGAIESVNFEAVSYFEKYLVKEFENTHIAEILNRVKNTLAAIGEIDNKYFRQALLNIKKNVERRIELKKEEILNRTQIESENTDEKSVNKSNENQEKIGQRETRQKAKGLNREVAYLFVDYLFDFAKINCPNTQKAEIVEFLTGFSSKQLVKVPSSFEKFKLQIEDGDESDENFTNDLKVIRKYFEELGLIEIVNKIDKDLGN